MSRDVPERVVLNWSDSPDGMSATGPDGTRYALQREQTRFEGTWWSAHYQTPAMQYGKWKNVPIGDIGHRQGPQKTRCKRYAEQRLREAQDAE